jgi:uncharacterized protein (TIGR00369 family)
MTDSAFSEQALREYLEAIPAARTFGYRIEELAPGRAVVVAPYDSSLDGIYASFHGGMLATLADSAGGAAAMTVMEAGTITPTTDLSIRFLAPCRTDARATARVIRAGRTLIVAEVNIHDMRGRHITTGQVSYMRLHKKTR